VGVSQTLANSSTGCLHRLSYVGQTVLNGGSKHSQSNGLFDKQSKQFTNRTQLIYNDNFKFFYGNRSSGTSSRDNLDKAARCVHKARFHYSDFLETSSKLVGFKFHYSDFPETNSNEFVSSLSRTCLEFVSRKLETSRASFGVSNGQSSKPTWTNHLDMSRWSVRVSS
jgi:hypothetical protein